MLLAEPCCIRRTRFIVSLEAVGPPVQHTQEEMKAGSVKGLAAQHHGIREPQRPMVKRSLLLSAHSACGSSTSQPSRGGASYLLWRHAGVLGSPSSVSKPSCRSRGLAPPLASTPEDHLPASPDSNEHPLYEKALSLARASKFQEARQLFEALLTEQPHLCKAWVSYAQVCADKYVECDFCKCPCVVVCAAFLRLLGAGQCSVNGHS